MEIGSGVEGRFQSIFRNSAVSLWEENIAVLRAALAALRVRGVLDMGTYLDEHPEFLSEAARMITVVDVNDATLALYEVADRQQLLGPLDRALDLDDPVVRESLRDVVLLIAEGGARLERESKATTSSGKRLDTFIRLFVPGPNDADPHMLVSVLDITRYKHVEEELHKSRQLLQLVLDHVPQRIFWKDTSLRFLGCNRHFAEDAGLSNPAMILGKDDLALSWRSTADRYRADDASVIETGIMRVNYEEPQTREDGSLLWLRTSKVPLREQDGRVFGILGTYEDITESKKAEEALRESEQRYRSLVENSNEGILVVQDGMLRYVNRAGFQMGGYTEQETSSTPFLEFIHPDDRDAVKESYLRRLRGEEVLSRYIFRLVCKSGDIKWVELSGALIQFEGRPAVLSIVTDITERKQAEEEKARLERQLQQAQKMESVGRLAGGVAHDFNNMLEVILGHTEMALEQMDPSQPLHADLEEIRKAAERSAGLTRQLLAFARRQPVLPRVLDMNQAVEKTFTMLGRLVGENVQLIFQPKADLWSVMVDPSQVDQVLTNLCVNARDAIDDVGKITIETGNCTFDDAYCADHPGFAPGEYVLLGVSDNGRGMDRETLSHLFEPFFTTKGMEKGTGLGLATVYGIVKQNNGFINVYSEHDHGTRFTIYLPRHAGTIEQARGQEADGPLLRGQETILLVEDESAGLNLIRKMLEMQGYTVLAAARPSEAIRLAREYAREIHLLITDVVMPEMNGRDLARSLLSLHPHLKFLFASGYTANVIAHHGVLEEGVHFIQKPFSRKDLAAKVREALQRE